MHSRRSPRVSINKTWVTAERLWWGNRWQLPEQSSSTGSVAVEERSTRKDCPNTEASYWCASSPASQGEGGNESPPFQCIQRPKPKLWTQMPIGYGVVQIWIWILNVQVELMHTLVLSSLDLKGWTHSIHCLEMSVLVHRLSQSDPQQVCDVLGSISSLLHTKARRLGDLTSKGL